jgi:hypothetical protein
MTIAARFVDAEDALHEEAARATGLGDFGDPSYREALRVVLHAYDDEARFHDAGRAAARANIVQLLATRLRSERGLTEHRARLATDVRRPLVVLGLVRTGSTTLPHLLGQERGIQTLEYWLASRPQPRPPRETWEAHPDFRASVAEIEAMYAFDPALRSIHLMQADLAEECRHLLAQSFVDDSFEVNATVPSYTRWYEGGRHAAAYRRHRALLGLIASTRPDARWALKYPVHVKHLESLLEVYPDACIVWTHRDPARVLASYVELIAGFRAIYERDIDRAAIATEQLEVWAAGAERAIAVRGRHDRAQFHDVMFDELVADPIGTVRRVYDRFGLDFTADAEQRMRAWQASTVEGKRDGRPARADLGLGDARVHERFAAYMRHFDLAPERGPR